MPSILVLIWAGISQFYFITSILSEINLIIIYNPYYVTILTPQIFLQSTLSLFLLYIFSILMDPEQPKKQMEEKEVNEEKEENTVAEQVVEDDDGSKVTPYDVAGKIDYNKLLVKFGCHKVNQDVIERIQSLTKQKAHRYLRRDIFYAHRDLNLILNAYEKNENKDLPPFYLYTGRGPSSDALHLGHMLPFIFNKYMQQAFNIPFVIQVTDDEKYFFKEGGDLDEFTKMAFENIKDILALGFDPEKTFIFIDSQYMGHLYPNVCRFQKNINMSTLKAIFGLDFADCCGRASYPAIQAAPCLSSSFPHIFGNKNIPCLIPCGIDQDPYFRMTRDVCARIKAPKPAGLYSKFFPALQGFQTKMSASDPNSGIFMTDTAKQIENKIKKHAFSGGKATKEEQQKYGADLTVDIAYQYLCFFMEDDKELEEIGEKYRTGKLLTGEVKKILIKIIQQFVADHQERRKGITDEDVKKFLSLHPRKFEYGLKE